jgi:hypothetical protein
LLFYYICENLFAKNDRLLDIKNNKTLSSNNRLEKVIDARNGKKWKNKFNHNSDKNAPKKPKIEKKIDNFYQIKI